MKAPRRRALQAQTIHTPAANKQDPWITMLPNRGLWLRSMVYFEIKNMYKILLGTIIDVNSKEYTCHIKAFDPETNRGYTLENVPFLSRSQSSDSWAGSTEIPERLSPCLIIDFNGQYYILDTVPPKHVLVDDAFEADKNISLTQTTESYMPGYQTSIDQVEKRKFLIGARGRRPHDALPGDKFWRTREGAFLGLLRGGVVIAKVHEFCQFMLNKIDGLGRLVVRNFQAFFDWGRLDVLNNKGNTNLSLNAGESYSNNKQEKFTVHLDVGSVGELIHLRVTTADGEQVARLQVFADGKIEVQNVKDIDVTTEQTVNVTAAKDINITATNNVNIAASNDITVTAANNITISAANNLAIHGVKNTSMSLGDSSLGIDENGNISIVGSSVYIAPNVQIDGSLSVSGSVSCQSLIIGGYTLDEYTGNYLSTNGYAPA